MTKIKLGAAVLALLVSTALPVETPLTGDLFGAPAAQAGVWGKIKGAANAVGDAAEGFGRGAKVVGGDIKNGAKAAWNGVDRGLGAIQKKIHDKYTPKPAPLVGKPLPKPPAGQPGSWGGQASN